MSADQGRGPGPPKQNLIIGAPTVVGVPVTSHSPAVSPSLAKPELPLDDCALPLFLLESDGTVPWGNAALWSLISTSGMPTSSQNHLESFIHVGDRHRVSLPITHPIEVRFICLDRCERRFQLRLAGYMTSNGSASQPRALMAAIDVEERCAEADLQLSLHLELGHRLRNLIAVVAALVNDTVGQHPSTAGVKRLHDRLRSLQAASYVGDEVFDNECSLRRVALRILSRFHDPADGRVTINGDDVRLSRRWGNTLALILHELATNCVKYGALSNRVGRIVLTWCTILSAKSTVLHIEWREIGGPVVHAPLHQGQGLSFIERVLRPTNDARMMVRFPTTGFVCQLDLPIDYRR